MNAPLPAWKDKIVNPAQVGGIETSVIDNGPGKGTRIAWINTGTGLRYKLVIDRAMDIADAFFNQYSLAWLSHGGVTYPEPFTDRGTEWLRTFGGGLLATCGLTHVGVPEDDAYGTRGLHGPIGNIPALLESVIQPDLLSGKLEMSITSVMKQSRVFGPNLELRRKVSGTLGQPLIRIQDEVVNRGNTMAPHMMLYHFNFGWPLVDEGTDYIWKGKWESRDPGNDKIFRKEHNFRKCMAPLEEHSGGGEEAAFIDVDSDEAGNSICGLYNAAIGLAAVVRFKKDQLPWLTNWQHWGKGEYVTGLEPGTHPPIGQGTARTQKTLLFIEPGETKLYELEFEIITDKTKIDKWLLADETF